MSVEPLLVSGFESRGFLQPQLVNAVVQIAALIDANDFFRCNGRHLTLRGHVVFGHVDERVCGLFPRYSSTFAGPYPDRSGFPPQLGLRRSSAECKLRALEEGGSPSVLKSPPENRVTRVLS